MVANSGHTWHGHTKGGHVLRSNTVSAVNTVTHV